MRVAAQLLKCPANATRCIRSSNSTLLQHSNLNKQVCQNSPYPCSTLLGKEYLGGCLGAPSTLWQTLPRASAFPLSPLASRMAGRTSTFMSGFRGFSAAPPMPRGRTMHSALKDFFGHSAFRPLQQEIVEAVLAGRDSLTVMATGSGKSLCYQLPPLVSGKPAIIISPLISLMQDQVRRPTSSVCPFSQALLTSSISLLLSYKAVPPNLWFVCPLDPCAPKPKNNVLFIREYLCIHVSSLLYGVFCKQAWNW